MNETSFVALLSGYHEPLWKVAVSCDLFLSSTTFKALVSWRMGGGDQHSVTGDTANVLQSHCRATTSPGAFPDRDLGDALRPPWPC